jgi:hypothetical protein
MAKRKPPTPQDLLARARKQLELDALDGRRVTALVGDLFVLSTVHGRAADPEVVELRRRIEAAVAAASLETLVASKIEYAMRLSDDASDLMFEELGKLYSLCEDVHALLWLGQAAPEALVEAYKASVRGRLTRQWGLARQTAEQVAAAWSRSMWWSTHFTERSGTRDGSAELHERGVASFIIEPRRQRFIDQLQAVKQRPKLRARLAHFADFEEAAIVPLDPGGDVAAQLRARGAPAECWTISEAERLDGRAWPLTQALTEIVGSGIATIVSCMPGTLAFYEGESIKRRFMLVRPRTK